MYSIEYDTFVVPAVDGDFVGDGRSTHGVYPSIINKPIPDYYSHMRGGASWRNQKLQESFIEKNDVELILQGTWVYLGIYLQPFGHFLSESIHRLWYLKQNKDNIQGVIFIPSVHQPELDYSKLPSYVKDVLDFYIDGLDVVFISNLTKVEKLIIPKPGSQLGGDREEWYSTLPRNNFLGESKEVSSDIIDKSKIIISRSKYYDRGRLLGVDYFWALLEDLGFVVISPENYSIGDQLSVLKDADVVIWEEGSAMHLLELFKSIKGLHLLISRRGNTHGKYSLGNFLKRVSSSSAIFDAIIEVESSGVQKHNQLSLIKNPKYLKEFLEKHLSVDIAQYNYTSFCLSEYQDLKKLALSKITTRDYLIDASFKLASVRANNE